ncbi:MAG: secretin N-terminal domain-containing protein [bacterium]
MKNHLRTLVPFLLLGILPLAAQTPQVLPPGTPVTPTLSPPAEQQNESVSITFPRNSVLDVISFYETLTGKRIIRDSNLAGQELSIMVAKPVSREDAIAIIESSLLMNNYSIVPVDDKTIKILGPSRAPRTEGLPLLSEIQSLPPDGDKVLSFYKPLAFISPEEAIAVVQGVVQINAYGSVVPVPNTNAIILTDKTPVIRKALGILDLIDVEPARVVTEFVQLQRANAERVVEILDEMFGKDDASKSRTTPTQLQGQPNPESPEAAQSSPASAGASGARYENRLIAGKAKFLADKRTNRILVVTRVENYRYVRDVISQLDSPGNFEKPFTRVLNYVPVNDIFPVLTDMLSDPDSDKQGGTGQTGQNGTRSTPLNPSSSNNNSQNGMGGIGGDGLNRPDRLSNESQQGAPQSATIGEIRIIADNNSNSVIMFGPPESKARAQQILDILDQRPKQVYLAVVIGQLRLSKGVDYGVSYLIRNKGFQPLNNLLGNSDSSGMAATSLSPNLLPGGVFPNAASIVNPASLTTNGLSSLAGLTVYGTIADSVDVFARFLENTDRFRTLSRPVIYTTNNRKATILSGQKVPVPTQSLTSATGGGISGNGSSITSNIQYQDVVLKLEVIPLINSDREVNLIIAQTNDNVVGTDTISGNKVPIIATQEITTSVRVPNGTTIVLGGLISEDKERGVEGMPYISDIPVIGSLLGGRTQSKIKKNELIVMIQPFVVDSNHEMMKASAYEGDRSPLGRDGQAMTAPVAEQKNPPAVWKPTPIPPEKKKKFRWPWTNDQYN